MKLPFINRRAIVFTISLAIIATFWVIANPRVDAQGKRLPKPKGHISDLANVLDGATRQRLETVLENLKHRTGVDLVVAVVPSVGTEDIYDYSLWLANDWNIGGQSSPNKSLLLVIAADTSRIFTQFSKSARADLPDGLIGEMGRRMRAKISTSGFSLGLVAGVQTFVDRLGEQ